MFEASPLVITQETPEIYANMTKYLLLVLIYTKYIVYAISVFICQNHQMQSERVQLWPSERGLVDRKQVQAPQ